MRATSHETLFQVGKELDEGRNQVWASPDGQRFLVNMPLGESPPSTFTVVQNWPALLEE